MQTFTPVESTEPLKDPAPAKEAEKPEGGKGMRQAADFCQILYMTIPLFSEMHYSLN